MRPVAKGMAEDRTELTKPVAAVRREVAEQTGKRLEAALEEPFGGGRRALPGAVRGGAGGQREVNT